LVDSGVFEEIYINFLPVGHTHCDIDQVHMLIHSSYRKDVPTLSL
jgi:hypothetical protein